MAEGGGAVAEVSLRPMSADEYRSWYDAAVREYAAGHAESGNISLEEAQQMAKREFEQLLPQGPDTPGQHLFTMADSVSGEPVGTIWFAERGAPQVPHAFIYDIVVSERLRGKGYGKSALLAIEPKVRELGLQRIALHVFGTNKTAIGLYERTGYEATNLLMAKDLS